MGVKQEGSPTLRGVSVFPAEAPSLSYATGAAYHLPEQIVRNHGNEERKFAEVTEMRGGHRATLLSAEELKLFPNKG